MPHKGRSVYNGAYLLCVEKLKWSSHTEIWLFCRPNVFFHPINAHRFESFVFSVKVWSEMVFRLSGLVCAHICRLLLFLDITSGYCWLTRHNTASISLYGMSKLLSMLTSSIYDACVPVQAVLYWCKCLIKY